MTIAVGNHGKILRELEKAGEEKMPS